MKRIVFIVCFAFVAVVYAVGQIVSSSSLVVTKAALPDVKPGYEQSIDLSYTQFFNSEGGIDINYIGGWRFNHMFYAGLGTGLYFDATGYGDKNPRRINSSSPYWTVGLLDMPVVSIPLYAHGKVYFTQKRWMPFVGLSVGGIFSTPIAGEAGYLLDGWKIIPFSYGTCRFLLNPMVGVDYRINADMDLYFSLGYRGMTRPYVADLTQYDITVGQQFIGAIDLHVGFTF